MKLLDVTIRDGGYAVDFRFTRGDVKRIVSKLVRLGIEYIEVGHGMGLNASSPERGVAVCSDEVFCDAAKSVSGKAKLGVFCIPGIARLSDLQNAKDHGIAFIRIGVHADQTALALKYIHEAQRIGLMPMVNFMKTYAVSPTVFAQQAESVMNEGAECVYIVDSAGCMLPEQLDAYAGEVRARCGNIKMGFHGHNNLGMAVCNSVHCADLGFDFIDCSFQGIGRSSGNAPLEQVVMILEKKYGQSIVDIDIPRLLEYGYILMKDADYKKLQNPLEYICGYSGFHSGFIKEIYQCCAEENVDPLRLIIAYAEKNKRSMDCEQLHQVAKGLRQDDFDDHPYSFRQYFGVAGSEYN